METKKNNSFIKLQESAAGRVQVNLQKNQFAKEGVENFYGKVERYTYTSQNILDTVAGTIPQIDLGTVTSVLNAYTNTILDILSKGSAVRFGELGTFYIAGKGVVDSETGKPDLTVKFSSSPTLKKAVEGVEITRSEYNIPQGKIFSITDVTTANQEGVLTLKGSILIEGTGLKVGGADSGIWFVPLTEQEKPETDESKWINVSSTLVYNLPGKLLFSIPESLSPGTSYKILIKTRYGGKSNYERKYLLTILSDPVTLGIGV